MQIGRFSPRSILNRLADVVIPQPMPDVGVIEGVKPRVLYIVTKYPEFSETYIHEEMVSVSDDYEIRIVDYERCKETRENGLPHIHVRYRDSNLAYGSFRNINTQFTNRIQRKFIESIDHVIEKFRPHVMHAHYFPNAWLARFLSDRHSIPFTVRTHSFDMLGIEPKRMQSMLQAVDTPRCLRVFAYPEFKERFAAYGIPSEKVASYWPICNVKAFYTEVRRTPTKKVLCAGPCTPKKAHQEFVDLANMMRGSGYQFDLYAKGFDLERIAQYNRSKGSPVRITYADPELMPAVYQGYDWLVYPLHKKINKVGLPVAVVEAQASGIGVCLQESPGRRQAQLDFLGGGGFLFNSIDEVPQLLTTPYPEEMRLNGLRNCWKCDVSIHKEMLKTSWAEI